METRLLGKSGFAVPVLTFGSGTFSYGNGGPAVFGTTGDDEARRLVDICLDAGACMFDSADAYSGGESETILGKAIAGRRNKVLISTKTAQRVGDGANDVGTSRRHIIEACEGSLKRLGVDVIDLYQMHCFDALTPVQETMRALDDLVTAGKIRYIGCSNYSGWHVLKSLWTADRHGWTPFVAHQAHYSLLCRDYEWELMPLGQAEGIGGVIWSPLAQGRLTGKLNRNNPVPEGSRKARRSGDMSLDESLPEEQFFRLVDELQAVASEVGRSVSAVAVNWVLCRPTVSTVIVGARTEEQLRDILTSADFTLSDEQVKRLEKASRKPPAYPYWHQVSNYTERNPFPVDVS
ncbi:MAG: aldo/keto reductase [Planctomycetes bacterium]|nr:aldo/keto reductase [Planctomycetota bacterium]MCD7896993.1 aldo/keto reductase [Planctomycetaceae bacterium]